MWEDASAALEHVEEENDDLHLAGFPFPEVRERAARLFAGVEDGARRISSLVQRLKNFSRREENVESRPVDLREVVESALALVGHSLRPSTDRLEVAVDDPLPRVLGNVQEFEQVLVNILQNAYHALDDRNSGIRISTAVEEETVTISVADEGIGMTEHDARHIFDPFFTTKRERGGTGLGLAISAGIMKRHGGKIEFQSELGEGSTFRCVFAIAKDAPDNDTPLSERGETR